MDFFHVSSLLSSHLTLDSVTDMSLHVTKAHVISCQRLNGCDMRPVINIPSTPPSHICVM